MKKSKRLFTILIIVMTAVLLAACGTENNTASNTNDGGDVSTDPAQGQFIEEAPPTAYPDIHCQAIETNPRGNFSACVTTHCSQLFEDFNIHYKEESDIDQCGTEDLVGICSQSDFDVYYYEGEASDLEKHCALFIGDWSTP